MTTKTKIESIDLHAKEWFDRTYGNSYFTAVATVNFGLPSVADVCIPFQYGYGSHYETEAMAALVAKGYLPDEAAGNPMAIYCRDHGIILRSSKETGCRKRDVVAYGNGE